MPIFLILQLHIHLGASHLLVLVTTLLSVKSRLFSFSCSQYSCILFT